MRERLLVTVTLVLGATVVGGIALLIWYNGHYIGWF